MTRNLNRRVTPKALTLAMAGVMAPTLAMAGFTLGDTMPTTEEALRAQLTGQGYVVEEVEIDDGMLEVEATKDGVEFELVIKPNTGEIIKIEQEPDDDKDDD
jgi:hypothetical protein